MFLCNEKKKKWYLKNHLAKEISGNPDDIVLTFKPKGMGHAGNEYYLHRKFNYCVVCGSGGNLVRCHIIPKIYKKYLPEKWSHDVVLTCRRCSKKIETKYNELIKNMENDYHVPICGITEINAELKRAKKACIVLKNISKNENENKIPKLRIKLLKTIVEAYLDIPYHNIDSVLINEIIKTPHIIEHKHHGEIIVERLDGNVEWFIIMWRNYFKGIAKPKFMPANWSVGHNIRYNEDDKDDKIWLL